MDFKELIRETGKRLGIEDLEPDENNVCHLVSEEMTVTLEWPGYYNVIIITAAICEIPPERRNDVELFRAIAQANYQYRETYGATISVDPKSERVYIFRYDRAYDWTPEDLLYVVGRVAQGVLNIRKLVAHYGAPPSAPDEPGPVGLVSPGFLRV